MGLNRGEFLGSLLAGLFAGRCSGGFGSSSSASQLQTGRILFRLDQDPERMINGYEPDRARVLNQLNPDLACFWLSGAKDDSESVHGQSMSYIRDWAQKRHFAEWTQQGYSLMLIKWGNYDGQNPELGQPTLGDYHISQSFLQDMQEIISIFKSQAKTKVYIALATEQSTYTACWLSTTCEHRTIYTDIINDLSRSYYTQLRDKLIKAINLIKNSGLDAVYGKCFGGWLVEFREGINFIKFFELVVSLSNAIFLQSMFDHKTSGSRGYGNPQRISKNCQFFKSYGKPLHLAHYISNNKRADVISDNQDYMRDLYKLGLRIFSFTDCGVVKENRYGSLDRLGSFRDSLREVKL